STTRCAESVSSKFQPFFFSSRRRHTRFSRDWSSDVCSSDLKLRSEEPKTMVVQATDRPAAWRMTISSDPVVTERVSDAGDADATVRGPATQLYLALWNRITFGDLNASGAAELLNSWAQTVRINWSSRTRADRHLERQLRRRPDPAAARLAGRRRTRRAVPAGTEVLRCGVSARRSRRTR